MSVIDGIPLLLGGEGYQISRSVRLRASASAYFSRTPGVAGNRKTWTWSGWVKRGVIASQMTLFSSGPSTDYTRFIFNGSDQLELNVVTASTARITAITSAVFRDPSAWYHVVLLVDTTQATASNGVKVYVNGVQQTATVSPYLQNVDTQINSTTEQRIGQFLNVQYLDGYLTEINFIDGQALTPSSFGETDAITGVWKPKKYVGTYGTNGFFLNFSDNSNNSSTTIGKDYSGNGNNWTPNNISVTAGSTYDSMLDVPTLWADGGNGRGNYAVLNPLNPSSGTVSDGNLRQLHSAASYQTAISTMAMPSGKWYCEITCTAIGGTGDGVIGVSRSPVGATFTGNTADSYGWYSKGSKYNNGSSTAYASGAQWTTGDVIGIAFDNTVGSFEFYKNGTALGVAFSGLTLADYYFAVSSYSSTTFAANFGQRPFAYTPPTGFKALNTQNLPEPTIKKGNAYFDVSLWTGNGGASQSIVNSGAMQPDLVWVKDRSVARNHNLLDSVRGPTKGLFSNLTNAEVTSGYLSSFDSNGFTVGNDVSTNGSGETFVGWQWKEGATQGFDIVTYTGNGVSGRTISHSLGVTPKLYILKRRDAGGYNWIVQTTIIDGSLDYLFLNTTAAKGDSGDTPPTSSVFSVSGNADVNANGGTYVAYLFSEVAGFSKFGSYTGNGSADGPFVFTGFLPRWVMIKRTDSTSAWLVIDTTRQTYNVQGPYLMPNTSDAETTGTTVLDVVSNGFKSRSSSTLNTNGGTYIYAAFAESPFKLSLAR